MKTLKLLFVIGTITLLPACYKPGKIEVQNNISQAKIVDVSWGKAHLASELLPGQSSREITISKNTQKLPSCHKIVFKMSTNGQEIYLETEDSYMLNEDGNLFIRLTDSTKVKNPNQ